MADAEVFVTAADMLRIDAIRSAVAEGQISETHLDLLAALVEYGLISEAQLQEFWMSRHFGLLNHRIEPVPVDLRASGMHELHEAAITGDAMKISRILGEGHDANMLDDCGSTALMHACHWGKEQAVYALLMMGADTELQAPHGGGGTALCMACIHGPNRKRSQGVPYDASRQLGLVVYMLVAGASRAKTIRTGETPLELAFQARDSAIIRILQLGPAA